MAFTVMPHLKEKIVRRYEQNMASYPQKRAEVEAFLQGREEAYALCLKFLYGQMHVNDIVTCAPEQIGGYAGASLRAYDLFPYGKAIPQEVFFAYVLQPRVNSEWLDESRTALMEEIAPHIRGKTMEQAALSVNYWCCSHAAYTPADDRTLGPAAVMRRTLGRCGEESVLAVAALRSVGIPARQCYVPRWSHCDDNHAWVEVWIDGRWRYMGACEPEPALDRGWFTAAASRAMLVHTRCWSGLGGEPDIAYTTPLYGLVNHTSLYADTKTLTVRLTENGLPLPDVTVEFQIANSSELYTIFRTQTGRDGAARFVTGLGDIGVYVCRRGRVLLQKVDMRLQNFLELDTADARLPEELPEAAEMDFVPPLGRAGVPPAVNDPGHDGRMRACEEKRRSCQASFRKAEGDTAFDAAVRNAAGNWREVQQFLDDARYTAEEKALVLSTLREKDLVDITCGVLSDALDSALPVRARYEEGVFRDYVLAPRVADEMLLPCRSAVRELFPEGFESPEDILSWMQENMEMVPDWGVHEFYPSAYGCLKYRRLPGYSFDMVFVSLCRAFGFPARLHSAVGEGQWLREGEWQSIRRKNWTRLHLVNRSEKALHYGEQFTLGLWNGQSFDTLRFDGMVLGEECTLSVPAGFYRLNTTTRQIDGTASVRMLHFDASQRCVPVQVPEDQTAKRLRHVPLLPGLPNGPVKDKLQETAGKCRIFVFADPGSEPTEHLLQEFLDSAEDWNRESCRLCIMVRREEELQNPTLQSVMRRLVGVQTQVCSDPDAQTYLHKVMGIGDQRLPFVLSVDAQDRGVYASANYNIRMARTLLLIQKLILGGM